MIIGQTQLELPLGKMDLMGKVGGGHYLHERQCGSNFSINNLLSTNYVPGIVLKAGDAKRIRGLLCPAPWNSQMVKMTITIQCDDTTRMLREP